MANEDLKQAIIDRLARQKIDGGSHRAAAEYTGKVAALLDNIKSWLADVKAAGLIDFQDETHHLKVGAAGLTCLGLSIVSDKTIVQVVPVGNRVPGALGRVDLVSTRKRRGKSIVLSEAGDWCVVEPIVTRTENYRDRLVPLDEQRFLKIFGELI